MRKNEQIEILTKQKEILLSIIKDIDELELYEYFPDVENNKDYKIFDTDEYLIDKFNVFNNLEKNLRK